LQIEGKVMTGFKSLCRNATLASLAALLLSGEAMALDAATAASRFADAGIKIIGKEPTAEAIEGMKSFSFPHNYSATDEDLALLAEHPVLSNLSLGDPSLLTPRALDIIATMPAMRSLTMNGMR